MELAIRNIAELPWGIKLPPGSTIFVPISFANPEDLTRNLRSAFYSIQKLAGNNPDVWIFPPVLLPTKTTKQDIRKIVSRCLEISFSFQAMQVVFTTGSPAKLVTDVIREFLNSSKYPAKSISFNDMDLGGEIYTWRDTKKGSPASKNRILALPIFLVLALITVIMDKNQRNRFSLNLLWNSTAWLVSGFSKGYLGNPSLASAEKVEQLLPQVLDYMEEHLVKKLF